MLPEEGKQPAVSSVTTTTFPVFTIGLGPSLDTQRLDVFQQPGEELVPITTFRVKVAVSRDTTLW